MKFKKVNFINLRNNLAIAMMSVFFFYYKNYVTSGLFSELGKIAISGVIPKC